MAPPSPPPALYASDSRVRAFAEVCIGMVLAFSVLKVRATLAATRAFACRT